jgi:hypothetical protein
MCREIPLYIIYNGIPLELLRIEHLPSFSASVLYSPVREFIRISFRIIGTLRKTHFLVVVFKDSDFFVTNHYNLASLYVRYFLYLPS